MAENNTIGTKSNFADRPEIPPDQKLTALEFNQVSGFQKRPAQPLTIFADTNIIVDGTKEYSTTKVITGATHTITASNVNGNPAILSTEHRQGNYISVQYQFDVDCTLTLVNFYLTGSNTGIIAPISAGTYVFNFRAKSQGIILEIPKNAQAGAAATKLDKVSTADQSVSSNVTFDKNASVSGKLIAFTNAPIFDVNNSNIQEMPVTAALSSINISGAAAGGNYRILLKNGVSGPYTYPSLGTSFGTATTNSESLDGSSKVMNMIDIQVTKSTPIVVVHSIETVTLP